MSGRLNTPINVTYCGVLMFQVLCLDECTANIDIPTASILQDVISSECQGLTVITIAHRISTVLNMDNILVLEKGSLVCSHSLRYFETHVVDSPT